MTTLSYFDRLTIAASQRCIPLEVSIELTHHCNFRCQHCYIPDFHAPDLLTTERLLALLDELTNMGTLFVTFTGGEIFLRRDWYAIASRARELGFSIRLFTNAALVSEQVAEQIVTLNCVVEASLYSMNSNTFERITQRRGSYQRTLQGIERLRAREIEVLLKVPMMHDNYRDLAAIFDYAKRIGAVARADSKIVAKKNGDPSTLALRVEPEELMSYYRGPFSGCTVPGESDADPRHEGPLCAAANRYANITSSGDVQACNILPGSGGNLNQHSFQEIWENSPWLNEVRAIRRRDLKECNTCSRFSYCGRCQAQALVEDGDIRGPSSWARRHAEALEQAFDLSASDSKN